jgi:hypothetical protein
LIRTVLLVRYLSATHASGALVALACRGTCTARVLCVDPTRLSSSEMAFASQFAFVRKNNLCSWKRSGHDWASSFSPIQLLSMDGGELNAIICCAQPRVHGQYLLNPCWSARAANCQGIYISSCGLQQFLNTFPLRLVLAAKTVYLQAYFPATMSLLAANING